MIPSTNKKLLVAEDWTKLYQSFKNADFKSYDFDTLRRTMISYLRENYPEDFNDYLDSSEYIALIDLIAYLGQNLSFRVDLNARENFLETAQRRDSILQLAYLINYNPARNSAASGLLKITAVTTTDNVLDANGINLGNTPIAWNDPSNSEWYQQFVSIINSTMPGSMIFGAPSAKSSISGIDTEQYIINSTNSDIPTFGFNTPVNGTTMDFEVVGSTFAGQNYVYETPPIPGGNFTFLFQNDNKGSGSSNTGFFVSFRQGVTQSSAFSIDVPVENQVVSVNSNNINNNDIWLWQLDSNNNFTTLWKQVPSLVGNNVIYNSLSNSERNIYAVITRAGDQVDFNFADGNFGDLPKGTFIAYYRTSNGLSYSITPDQMTGIQINIPYLNKSGQPQTLTLNASLQYTVDNSSGSESNESIKLKAPQTFYAQNRMVTGEDYNISPLGAGTDILKVKSVNRTASGISKYFELTDVSGQYSSTNIFATDGLIYKNTQDNTLTFNFTTRNQIYAELQGSIATIVASNGLRNFYWDNWPRPDASQLGVTWKQITNQTGQCTGYFVSNSTPQQVGYFSSNTLQYVGTGALVKFNAAAGQVFYNGRMLNSSNAPAGSPNYIWAKVSNVIGDGANSGKGSLSNGQGPIVLSGTIPSGAMVSEIIPEFVSVWNYNLNTTIVNITVTNRNFALSFDRSTRQWFVITETNLNLFSDFSLLYQGDTTNQNRDASWLIAFEWDGQEYIVHYRTTEYIFESVEQTAFYFDNTQNKYDFVNNTVIKDQINVLGINAQATNSGAGIGVDQLWEIDDVVIEPDGYQDPSKVKISFFDAQNNGQISDPDSFETIVQTTTTSVLSDTYGYNDKFVYFTVSSNGLSYVPLDITTTNFSQIEAYPTEDKVSNPSTSTLYYFYDPSINVVKSYSTVTNEFNLENSYIAFPGRNNLKFHYQHNSADDRRLDPSKTNIVDIYLLTSEYDTAYRSWLATGIGSKPLPPTSSSLEENYSSYLEPIKTISDLIIYQPAVYVPLFGSTAPVSLQATFKAVANSAYNISTNQLQTQILTGIENFFALENWDFGQQFNFSELSTYIMNLMTPYITNFVIVPASGNAFGSLLEISCNSNEIFVNGARISDIQIIDSITASNLGISGAIVTTAVGV